MAFVVHKNCSSVIIDVDFVCVNKPTRTRLFAQYLFAMAILTTAASVKT